MNGNRLLIALGILVAICVLTFFPQFKEIIILCGNNVVPYPGSDLVTDYLLGVFWALALYISLLFWPVSRADRRALLRIWPIKVSVALGVSLAYEYRYGLDPDGYFANAVQPDFVWEGFHFGKSGAQNIYQLVWLHLHIVPGSYHGAKVGFSMIGMAALYIFYRAIVWYQEREDIRLLYGLCLFPSILFWSSILGKDPITLLGMAIYCFGVIGWWKSRRWRYITAIAGGCLIASFIRMWYLPIMLGPLVVLNLHLSKKPLKNLAVVAVVMAGLVLSIRLTRGVWNIQSSNDLFELKSYANSAFEGGGSTFAAPQANGFGDVIRYGPLGLFTALFRPLPLEVRNAFGTIEGLDDLFMVILLVLAIKRTHLREIFDPLILWAISLVFLWGMFYGFTANNFGSLVRYKLMILPVLLSLLLYLSRKRRSEAPAPTLAYAPPRTSTAASC